MSYPICYLILCHNNPNHVKKVVDFLYSPDSYFAIHVDKKSTDNFSNIKENEHIGFVKNRVSTQWGDISVVDSVLALAEYGRNRFPMAKHYCLISGSDFPVKTHEDIKLALGQDASRDYIQGIKIPSSEVSWIEGGRRRIEAYVVKINNHNNATIEPRVLSWVNVKQLLKILLHRPTGLLEGLSIFISKQRRKVPCNLQIYAGEMWWILSNKTLNTILDWDKGHEEYHRYHLDSQIPDEMYINTLVWNLSLNVSPEIKRYIHWKKKTDKSPLWMTFDKDKNVIDDLIRNSEVFFARKIKEDRLEDYIISKTN